MFKRLFPPYQQSLNHEIDYWNAHLALSGALRALMALPRSSSEQKSCENALKLASYFCDSSMEKHDTYVHILRQLGAEAAGGVPHLVLLIKAVIRGLQSRWPAYVDHASELATRLQKFEPQLFTEEKFREWAKNTRLAA